MAYTATRAALSEVMERDESRLGTLTPYTGDFRFATFGVDRSLRLALCWGHAVGSSDSGRAWRGSASSARRAPSSAPFGGVLASPPGVSVASMEKRARAVTGLRAIVGGASVPFQERRRIVMFLISLLDVVNYSHEITHGLYVPLG